MGPTASGKSAWALDLAEKVSGVIINCDSVQVYQGARIGSSQPNPLELKRVPHFLYDYVDYPNEMTAGQFRDDFWACVSKIHVETPILVVGGTGFYFQAIEKGMHKVPEVNPDISKTVRDQLLTEEGRQRAWSELQQLDMAAAQNIHINDTYRLSRALELLRAGFLPSQIYRETEKNSFPGLLHKTCFNIPREDHLDFIYKRTLSMIQNGLIEETMELQKRANSTWAPLRAVGYKETVEFLDKGLTKEWLIAEICLRTRQLAKRQRTWFKKIPETYFFDSSKPLERSQFLSEGLRFFENKFKTE